MRTKICGLSNLDDIQAAATAGARYVGFVFFQKSPRNISISKARALAVDVPPGVAKVALVVDASDDLLDDITANVPLDMLQLHGSESPARVVEIQHRYGLPVMKAVGVADAADISRLAVYEVVADQILVDAKPAKGAALPGGNGLSFDWQLIAGFDWKKPWMLAGGLTPENVGDAIRLTGAQQVDVSSGVENAPGEKDPELIQAFIRSASTTRP